MICGRVCNLSTEDAKIKEQSIGLFNGANDPESCRIKLNVNELPQLMLFEGEVIVAEGYMDSKKFNVNRIIKPKTEDKSQQALFGVPQMQYCQNLYSGKALQAMIACGPFTINGELSFEPLKDLMPVINKEQPHALVLCGPFIS